MSTRDFTILRCDHPRCGELFRLPIDSTCTVDDLNHVRRHAAGDGWHTYSLTGLMRYTADYCPKHRKSTSEGIRGAEFGSRKPPCEFDTAAPGGES